MIHKIEAVFKFMRSLLPSVRAKRQAQRDADIAAWWATAEAVQMKRKTDVPEETRISFDTLASVPKRRRHRKVIQSPPLCVTQLRKVRSLFNSEYVSRDTNRHNQRAWVNAVRRLRATTQVTNSIRVAH